jgi:hypothetical protein
MLPTLIKFFEGVYRIESFCYLAGYRIVWIVFAIQPDMYRIVG